MTATVIEFVPKVNTSPVSEVNTFTNNVVNLYAWKNNKKLMEELEALKIYGRCWFGYEETC
jgi:hypothetical protein